ncbi:MAG: FtsX-like permease family protein, partial [Halobacteriales archaeon]
AVTTGSDGRVRLPIGSVDMTGPVGVTATKRGRTATATVTVDPDVDRQLLASLSVVPDRPTAATAPTAELELSNPWNRTVTRAVTVEGPAGTETRGVQLASGERTTVSVPLSRQPPGSYTVAATSDERLASTQYRVVGDARLSAALAATGRDAAPTGIGQAARVLFGNLELLLAVLLVLAGVTTAGATTAAFAGAVHARRRTLGVHRAVGASPGAVLRLVVADAAVVAVVATLLALVLAGGALAALARADLLTVYGVRLLSTVSPTAVAASAGAALALALVGAAGATWGLVRAPPSALLAERRQSTPAGTDGDNGGPGWSDGPAGTVAVRRGQGRSDEAVDREGDDG